MTTAGNTHRFADHKEKVIDLLAGDDGERRDPGQPRAFDPGAGMDVVRRMEKAER